MLQSQILLLHKVKWVSKVCSLISRLFISHERTCCINFHPRFPFKWRWYSTVRRVNSSSFSVTQIQWTVRFGSREPAEISHLIGHWTKDDGRWFPGLLFSVTEREDLILVLDGVVFPEKRGWGQASLDPCFNFRSTNRTVDNSPSERLAKLLALLHPVSWTKDTQP